MVVIRFEIFYQIVTRIYRTERSIYEEVFSKTPLAPFPKTCLQCQGQFCRLRFEKALFIYRSTYIHIHKYMCVYIYIYIYIKSSFRKHDLHAACVYWQAILKLHIYIYIYIYWQAILKLHIYICQLYWQCLMSHIHVTYDVRLFLFSFVFVYDMPMVFYLSSISTCAFPSVLALP